jgi:hypothetical protein
MTLIFKAQFNCLDIPEPYSLYLASKKWLVIKINQMFAGIADGMGLK